MRGGALLRTMLGTLALVGFFGVALATLYRYDLRLDLTPERRYSLSGHAKRLLGSLTREVELIGFLRGQNPRNPYIRDLLRQLANESPMVTWAEVDVNRSPAKAHQYGVTSYGAVVVKSSDRQRVVGSPHEAAIMWAILQVTRDHAKTVYFVTGHGEKGPADRDRIHGYSAAAARVQEEFYEVRTLGLKHVDAVPEDATLLVIGGPRGTFLPKELALLDEYLARDGKVLLMLDAFEDAGLAAYLARYGVSLRDETVVDPENRMFGGELVTMRVPVAGGAHPITEGLDAQPLFSLARTVEPGPAPASADVLPVLRSGPQSWATPSRNVLTPGVPPYIAGRDRRGPLGLGLAVSLLPRAGSGSRGGRLVVYGNSEFASNFFIEREGNADLLLNTIDWLGDEPALMGARSPRKQPGREQLLVLGGQGATIFWLAVVIQPGVFLLVGLVQFWRRRYGGS